MVNKYKKAQIGTTLTWFVAFFIIFFIMTIFISATFVISTRKRVNYGLDTIDIEGQMSSLEGQRASMILFNSEIGGVQLKEYIKNEIKKEGEESEKYEELFKYLLDFFEESDLLWRMYIFEPDRVNPRILTRGDWNRRKFECFDGGKQIENRFLDLNGKQIIVRTHICNGQIKSDSNQWGGR